MTQLRNASRSTARHRNAPPSIDAMPPTLNPVSLVSRVNRDVERSLLRARNGVRYVRGSYRRQGGRDA